jgi:hypothetical protein
LKSRRKSATSSSQNTYHSLQNIGSGR